MAMFRKLSDLREGSVVRHSGELAIVTDRSSGVTRLTYENGGSTTFIWDQDDPDVEYLGKGHLEIKIIIAQPAR